MKKGLRPCAARPGSAMRMGLNPCPDEEGIKTALDLAMPLAVGLNPCPDEEGIKT